MPMSSLVLSDSRRLEIIARHLDEVHFFQRHHRRRARQIFEDGHFADEFAGAAAGQHDRRVERCP